MLALRLVFSLRIPDCALGVPTYLFNNAIFGFSQTIENSNTILETIDKLKIAINDKDKHIALIHTRLLNRIGRQGVDSCRDELEIKLHEELADLMNNVKTLNTILDECYIGHQQLKQSIYHIEKQLHVKENSLHIDNELCVEQRKRVSYDTDI